jgi:malonate-semialdehyde dehydrogenase (acetylating)/methylmalonate-semialdehyde dehydrogenase
VGDTARPLVVHWVDGRPFTGTSTRTGDVYDPAAGVVVAQVVFAGAADVDVAVAAAKRAFGTWRAASIAERTRSMFRFRELLHARVDELATIVTREHGKVLDDARGEVARALEVVELACNVGSLLKGAFSEGVSSGVDVVSLRQPLGVVAVVSPFNFPAMVPCWFFPLAIATGNAVVLKPSEKDPSAADWLARLVSEAGFPPGVLNVVHGDAAAVDRLLVHPDVHAVSFVGSTQVARHVYETATRAGKRVQALGGAKNHMVVLPDADLDVAADAAVSAAYGSAGERCMAISVLVAVGDVGDRIVPKLVERVEALRVGDGRADVDVGPMVTAAHRDRVASYLDAGRSAGAKLVVDGREVDVHGEPGGFWLGPTLFDHVTPEMAVYTDEIFGPVLSVVRVPTFDDALALVDANPYGNGVAIFTNDGRAARRFASEVQVGMVGVNVPIPVPVAYHSFGGWKSSLFGDTHAYGEEGVRFFTRAKVVTSRWPEPSAGGVDLGFPRHS